MSKKEDVAAAEGAVVEAAIKWRDQERRANDEGGDHQRRLADRTAALRLAIDELDDIEKGTG